VHTWRLDSAAVVILTDTCVGLVRTSLVSADGGARVRFAGSFPLEGEGHVSTSIEALPLQDLFAAFQRDTAGVGGELSGAVELRGNARSPVFESFLALINGRYGNFQAPHLEGTADYANRRLTGVMSLRRLGARILDLQLDLPLNLALVDAGPRRLPGPLSIRASADGVDLAIAEALFRNIQDVSGRLDADVRIGGSWDRPSLGGTVAISQGFATFPGVGVRHENLNGRLQLTGDTIRVDSLRLRSGAGTMDVSGYIRLRQLTEPILALRLDARDFSLMDVRNFLTLRASGDVALAGPLFGATMTGRGTVSESVLYFGDLIRKQVVNLEDTIFRGVADTAAIREQRLGREFENRLWDSLRIDDLRLEMGSLVWLRSAEANIQLAGNVTVNKRGDEYRLDGVLTTDRGIYRLPIAPGLVTREFTVTRGEVRYFGTPDFNAALDIEAQHLVRRRTPPDVLVTANVGGTLEVPRLTLSSNARPPLSDTQIISLLLFGVENTADLQVANAPGPQRMVQEAARSLLGQVESSVSDLGVPLDYFQIVPGDIGGRFSGTQIALGWQINLLGVPAFFTVSPRICPTDRALSSENVGASLEFRLSEQFRLSTGIDPVQSCDPGVLAPSNRQQAGVDIFWERRF
jgi:translocation and assembly module TamB